MNEPIALTIEERIDLVRWKLSLVDRDREPQLWHSLIGTLGGLRTLLLHGPEHFQAAGKLGFEETCRRHFKGNKDALVQFLHVRASVSISDQEFHLMIELYAERRPELLKEV